MRILVIGKGGREHAIVKALALSASVEEVHAIPGSPGMQTEALCHNYSLKDHGALVGFCQRTSIDLVVIGPEDPLVDGLADSLRKHDILCFGPSQAAAQLEGSKIFAKNFMKQGEVPTADFVVVSSVKETLDAATRYSPPYVLKADGLAAGKGVMICENLEGLESAAVDLFEKNVLGESGKTALLEEFQSGREMSVFVLTNGQGFALLPFAQDHKRVGDGNVGPNTGGMGAIAPMNIDPVLETQLVEQVVRPSVQALSAQGLDYKGVLFIGVMLTPSGPKVIEYNVRFGDPEAQVLLPMIDGDWGHVFHSIASGNVPELRFRDISVSCVVLASPGYPEDVKTDVSVEGNPEAETSTSYFVHAGTGKNDQGQWVTKGGRVLGAVGIGDSVENSIQLAYKQSAFVNWAGLRKRTDIGKFQ